MSHHDDPTGPQTAEVGKTYGHLEVLEELPRRPGGRRWRCRCLNVVGTGAGEKACGNLTVKRTGELTQATKFRACRGCVEAYTRRARERWNGGPRR